MKKALLLVAAFVAAWLMVGPINPLFFLPLAMCVVVFVGSFAKKVSHGK